ncbi:MAG: hypothetical protein M1833_004340 [Piccolia ochrophora]|nr:MAG: hypothetical protein M1833_004340 [Piccolia ochrophora]
MQQNSYRIVQLHRCHLASYLILSILVGRVWPVPLQPGSPSVSPAALTASPLPQQLPSQPDTSANTFESCSWIQRFYQSTANDWVDIKTDEWLHAWWEANAANFTETRGFSSNFGSQWLGKPNWSCQIDGSDDNCGLDLCGNSALRNAGPDTQHVYYVLQSIRNLHDYFLGMTRALQIAAINSALIKDDIAYTFYKDKDIPDQDVKQLVNAIVSVVGAVAAFAAPLSNGLKILVGSSNAAFAGGAGATKYGLSHMSDDTMQRAAELGSRLSDVFLQSLNSLTLGNNDLMHGTPFLDTGDIRGYIAFGQFLQFDGVEQIATVNVARTLLASTAINHLWKQQKIFVMGGGPCDDSGGVGQGPQEAKYCRDNKAWYLFFWKENKGLHLSKKKWGFVQGPPGFDELGKGEYEGITAQDIISSSLDSNIAAGFDYSPELAQKWTSEALVTGELNGTTIGPRMQGIFTLPVCDIGPIVPISGDDFPKKDVILQPYGEGKVPQWCAPVCAGAGGLADEGVTMAFLKAAQMEGFLSFQSYCPMGFWLYETQTWAGR